MPYITSGTYADLALPVVERDEHETIPREPHALLARGRRLQRLAWHYHGIGECAFAQSAFYLGREYVLRALADPTFIPEHDETVPRPPTIE